MDKLGYLLEPNDRRRNYFEERGFWYNYGCAMIIVERKRKERRDRRWYRRLFRYLKSRIIEAFAV